MGEPAAAARGDSAAIEFGPVNIYILLSAVPPPSVDCSELLFKITSFKLYVVELLYGPL
jgi:hypothetical protein